jgi:hypothetical protein
LGDEVAILRIHDCSRSNGLEFDLRHLLDALAPQSLQASWSISPVGAQFFEATGSGGAKLEAMSETNDRVAGRMLAKVALETLQVIWGEFAGFLPTNSEQPWVTIRAIDSTFYEVATLDEQVVRRVESSFKDVRPFDQIWALYNAK